MHPGVGHEVGGDLVQVDVQVAGEAHGGGQVDEHSGQHAVQVVEALAAAVEAGQWLLGRVMNGGGWVGAVAAAVEAGQGRAVVVRLGATRQVRSVSTKTPFRSSKPFYDSGGKQGVRRLVRRSEVGRGAWRRGG